MSWEPAWVPDGRGGFIRQRSEEESEEPTDEEEGEISGRNEHRPRFGPRGRGFPGRHRGGGRGGRGEFFFREPAGQGNFAPRQQPFRDGPFRADRGRGSGPAGFHRPPELHREGSFGGTTRTDHHRDSSFTREVPPFRDMAAPVREPIFGPRNEGPATSREMPRDMPFGPRPSDLPPRESMREPPFGPREPRGEMGGPPPRDAGRDSSFGPRGADIPGGGGPSRDLGRDQPFGLARGDFAGPPTRDATRDASFAPRAIDTGASIGAPMMRDTIRDMPFGPRGTDISSGPPPREPVRGSSGTFPRGGPPPPRDAGIPPPATFSRGEPLRETSFSDLAGPPLSRDRPFRDDGPPRSRIPSQGPAFPPTTTSSSMAPSDPRRPTDPRRRSVQDLGGGPTNAGPIHLPSEGPPDCPPLPSPQPGRRLGSYSSLADNSTLPSNLLPAQAPPHLTGDTFRSPAGRRPALDPPPPRNADPFVGPPPAHARQSSWSPMLERRTLSASPRNAPQLKPPGFNVEGAPPAPTLSRGNSFRDPRGKPNDNMEARPEITLNSSAQGFPIRKKPFSDEAQPGRSQSDGPKPSPKSSPTKAKIVSSPNKEEQKSAVLPPLAPELPIPKADPPPLLTSALGQGDIVQRAETAVLHLSEVVDSKEIKATEGLSKLPEKQMIMTAVTEIEKSIKETQLELESCQDELKQALKKEAEEFELEQKRLAEDETRRAAEELQRLQQEKERQQEVKAQMLQKAIDDRQDDFVVARQKFEDECRQKIEQSKEDKKRQFEQGLESLISTAQEGFDKDIAKARTSVEKAKSSVTRLDAKLVAAETEYQSLLKTTQCNTDPQENSQVSSSEVRNMPSLVEQIRADNARKAREAQILTFSMASENDTPMGEVEPHSGGPRDPIFGKSCEEWSVLTKQVTGFSDALYTEPSEAPYYQHNEKTHALLAPIAKEFIRDQKRQLVDYWTVLAEEYEVRKRLYEKQQRKLAKKAQRSSVSVFKKSIFAGDKESTTSAPGADKGNILESGRSSNNPYRRARRGNEVRSEYEQEQIIAEIAAKEAMERRITHGGCKLPRQISRLERGFTASYINTFTAYKVDDPLKEAQEERLSNVWTDMEKCIFLDRFLQFPKDFRRIASFLRNKTTKDCVAFYYDSKQTVGYKGALKEHVMRRKRKGDYTIWDASIQAAISTGATVTAGLNEEKPVEFALPTSDRSYRTYLLHPLRRPVLDSMSVDEDAARQHEAENRPEEAKMKSKKRSRDPLFSLDKEHTKFLRMASQESMSGAGQVSSTLVEDEKGTAEAEPEESQELPSPSTPVRKAPQKWTTAEKKIFAETLELYGRDWAKLASAVGTKNEKQIKNFYYDWKKGKSRPPSEKKMNKKDKSARVIDEAKDEDVSEVPGETTDDKSEEDTEMVETAAKPPSQEDLSSQATSLADMRMQMEAMHEASHKHGVVETQCLDGSDFGGSNHELLQQLLSQQYQQQPQSALHQLLSQQHLQREQHHQQHLNQLSLEEARRLLEHHQPQRGPLLSNLLSSQWLGAPQLLQGQPGLTPHAIASALRGEGSALGGGISEMGDLQRLLQLHRASQGMALPNRTNNLASILLGGELNAPAGSNLSASLLQQLANAGQGSEQPDPLSSLASAQSLLGFAASANPGTTNLSNTLFRQTGTGLDSAGVSDALSLLARSMQRGDGNSHGFGRLNDSTDGSGRYV